MSERPARVAETSPSDLELLSRVAKNRDEAAFEVLMRRHQIAASNLAVHLTRNRDQAEDALQEAMLRAWSAAGSYRTEGSVRGWLLRIVVRECIKLHRGTVSERNRVARLLKAGVQEPIAPPGGTELENHLEVLRRLIAELAYQQRAILAMYFGAGLTHGEIGEELSIPRSTIALRIQECLATLRRSMARHGIEANPSSVAPAAMAEAVLSGESVSSNLLGVVRAKMSEAVPGQAGKAGKNSARAFARSSSPRPRRLTGKSWTGAVPWAGAALMLVAIGAFAWWPRMDEDVSQSGMSVPATIPDPMAPKVVKEQARDAIPQGTVLRTIELDKNYSYYGLACDGTYLWTCRGHRAAQSDRFRLAKMDIQTGSVVAYGPDLGDRQYTGLDWDGKDLWAVVSEDRKLLKLDTTSGKPLREVSLGVLSGPTTPWGVAVIPGKDIWVCDTDGAFHRLNYRTGKVEATLKPDLNSNLTWIVLAGQEIALVQGRMPSRQADPAFGHSVLRLDLATGKTSWLFHLSENHGSVDAAVDGAGRLWVLNKVEKRIRLYDLSASRWGAAGSMP